MRSQLHPVESVHLEPNEEGAGMQVISIDIPEDFVQRDLISRIQYVAEELKSQEAEYPVDKGKLIRHTSLIKVEGGKFHYAVTYVPYVDSEY